MSRRRAVAEAVPPTMPTPLSGTAPFAYDASQHLYICKRTGEQRPHITGMLKTAGLVDDRWFTDEGRFRGSAVHSMTLDLDLGALTPDDVESEYKNYLMAYASAVAVLRPTWTIMEEAFMHPEYRFGGRIDRGGQIRARHAIAEIKSGGAHKSHGVQLALQAILLGPVMFLPPTLLRRYVIRIQANGRYKVDEHVDPRDFDRAYDIIKECC